MEEMQDKPHIKTRPQLRLRAGSVLAGNAPRQEAPNIYLMNMLTSSLPMACSVAYPERMASASAARAALTAFM